MNISILHLSDLHIINKNGTYSEVLDNLINDAKSQCAPFKHIILVITGDIIDQAMYSEINIQITLNFFKKIQAVIGDKIVGVEIVPGNHDKERQEINQKLICEKRTFDGIANIDVKEWDYFLVPYKKYLYLANEIRYIFNKNAITLNNTYYVESIDEPNFKVIFINTDSSWSSYGGNADRRNLCIDERQLNELKEKYQKEKRETTKRHITIMTAHHPLNWLREKDESFISPWLLNSEYFNINLYLCGHTHDRQIKSFFDTYKSYITLVTGIGWGERTAEDTKDTHRYSIYNLNIKNNSCEIIIRKTRSDGTFDYDNDVLLSEEEKKDKRIYMPLNIFKTQSKIAMPIYFNHVLKNDYLFVNNEVLETINKIATIYYEVSYHMSLFQSMHVRDFFVKYELNKPSKGTIVKQETYDDYFYRNRGSRDVDTLFSNIKNYDIIYSNFLSYLRELCGTFINELMDQFEYIQFIRLHFRKLFIVNKSTSESDYLYITICQAASGEDFPPPIRDLNYKGCLIQIAFENKQALVYSHNKEYNPLPLNNSKYKDFITLAPNTNKNSYTYDGGKKDIELPFLTASLSITCDAEQNLLDILNYLGIEKFLFKLVYDYASLFKIEMKNFINREDSEFQ